MDSMKELAALLAGGGKEKPIEPVYVKLGKAIARMREARGMSQLELGQKCGMGSSTIAMIETGKSRVLVGDVELIAQAMGVEPRALMMGVWF